MSVRGLTGLFLAVVALVVVTGAAAAHRSRHAGRRPVPGERAALAAVKQAVAKGRLTRAAAKADSGVIAHAVHLVRVLPASRREHVEVALEQVGDLGKRLTAPRALAVFGQLQANDDYFARHRAPPTGTDLTDSDGIVYRYFAGRCFEFHPLANASALNARVAAKDVAGAQRLAAALIARAVPRQGGGVAWEYYFPFGGGRPPWVSGMAQAVAAQAFARASALVTDESAVLLHEATSAFRTAQQLTMDVAAGPWIRLYSFSRNPVLNAQLQSVLSLQTYATVTKDAGAAALASQMEQAAAATVGQFDTGYWTDYSLAGNPSPLPYQKFVIQLLRRLAPVDPRFAQAADRFASYLRQPPAFRLANSPVGALRFWLSKPAFVSARIPTGRSIRLSLDAGWHTFRWHEPKRAGFYRLTVTAVDYAGNRASFTALPIVHVPTSRRAPRPRRTAATGSVVGTSPFVAGAGIDDTGQGALASSLGLSVVRMTVPWQSGQTVPDAAVVSSLQGLPSGVGLVVDLEAARLPTDDAGRSALAGYAASLARQTPALRDLVLTPAPSRETAAPYADALAAVRSAVRSVRPDVGVGPFIDGSIAKPKLITLALARELARAGAPPDFVSFLPAPVSGSGTWALGGLGSLESTLAKGLGKAPPVLLDAVPVATTTVTPASQASMYAAAVETASCLPGVNGLLLDRLVDASATPEPATGLYYASGAPKPSAAAVGQAIQTVGRGAAVCPGLAAVVAPTTLTFPSQLSSSSAVSVSLGCARDCLYLVTLDRANGKPLVARRGTLAGGAAAKTITLPKQRLRHGSYRLDVRLVSRVDPGTVTRRLSPTLTVG